MVRKAIKLSKNLDPDMCSIIDWKNLSITSDDVFEVYGEAYDKTSYKLKYRSEPIEMANLNEANHGLFDFVFYKDHIVEKTIRDYKGYKTERRLLSIKKTDKRCKNLIEVVTIPFSDDIEIGMEDLYNFSFH